MKLVKYATLCCLSGVMIIACGKDGDQGPEEPEGAERGGGIKSRIDIETLVPGAVCTKRGINVKSGIDKNKNNVLEASLNCIFLTH